ncbi:MAG: tetratricopeptide repeat protein [Sphingomicrobium sp.]|nr:tetratricopeptide repeat protein [Sphingomonadales bacterium]
MRMRSASLFLTALSLAAPAIARDPPSPEQRIGRVEHQVRQLQRQVFPKGEPADTAGFSDAPAATKDSVDTLTSRLDAVERQMSDLVRTSEENTHRLSVLESDLARLRAEQDSRFKALESGPPPASGGAAPADAPTGPAVNRDPLPVAQPVAPSTALPTSSGPSFEAAGEAAYQQGYDLWSAKKYDQAITQLRAMVSSFPGHRRVSWANNLVGRALLDKGQSRAAAEALLANYRGNPKGERAPDSLYYLGQSLVKLGQPTQACKAYAELSDIYGATMRAQLKAMLPAARAQAQCK